MFAVAQKGEGGEGKRAMLHEEARYKYENDLEELEDQDCRDLGMQIISKTVTQCRYRPSASN